ncbi:sigma 54-interacting transcriptional regulator [Enterococcus sp. AZ103]|uniref:sigma 54-interacting transcriptional regulator n=1 Tax=Enterococcus sp. AZ103 TaxID=2774628 RepID=UPI003F1EBF82
MRETAEEKVLARLKSLEDTQKTTITTQALADSLGIKRNSASHYLNNLLEAGKVTKISGKPVKWVSEIRDEINNDNPFEAFIGSNSSLVNEIQQCQAAVEYPPKGLPIIINGKSGVGKSYLAGLIHDYCLKKELLMTQAPFVVLNCADYANNPELLSATLFGYKKGSFTGADQDRAGLINDADGGILFLDEVHRLSYENQEKLFLLMDQGIYRPLGDKGELKRADLRFIFATTENNDEVLLDTFRRRIPVSISLPDFNRRPFEERLNLIQRFYQNEVVSLKKDILITSDVLDFLAFSKYKGNIGRLKNLIKISCANAWHENKNENQLVIKREYFPTITDTSTQEKYIFDDLLISHSGNPKQTEKIILPYSRELIESFWEDIQFFNTNGFNQHIFNLLSTKINKIVKQMGQELNETIQETDISMRNNRNFFGQLDKLEKQTGVKFSKEEQLIFLSIYQYFQEMKPLDEAVIKNAQETVHQYLKKENYLAKKIIQSLASFKPANESCLEVFYSFVLKNYWQTKVQVPALIVTHGSSTASSMAAVVNYLTGDFVFEAIDMPIESSVPEIVRSVRQFVNEVDTTNGFILLVDMGSLRKLFSEIKTYLEGELLIINNVNTMMGLDIGTRLSAGGNFSDIVSAASQGYHSEVQYYEGLSKGENIVVSCISGLGIAEKLAEVIKTFVDPNKLSVITIDNERLTKAEPQDHFLENTRLVITTSEVRLQSEIPTLKISDILEPKGTEILKKGLRNAVLPEQFIELKDTLVRFFSIESISNSLTILNPQIVIQDVEQIISFYENYYDANFEMFKRLNLMMHIAIMIERLIGSSDIQEEGIAFSEEEEQFNKLTASIFSDIKRKYNIYLPRDEVQLLYKLIQS